MPDGKVVTVFTVLSDGGVVTGSNLVAVLGSVIFGRHQILMTLEVHDAFPPRPLYLPVARGTWTAGGECDVLQRKLWRTIGMQQSVGFLVGVGKLGIAESSEGRKRADHREQMGVLGGVLIRVV